MSRYSAQEQDNNQRFEELASRLSTFRSINQDIESQTAQDNSVIDTLTNNVSQLYDNIRNSSGRLNQSLQSGTGVWRMVALALSAFFVIYIIFKFI